MVVKDFIYIDVFWGVSEPSTFLREARWITKWEGFLIVDDGHQSRQIILQKIKASDCWRVEQETRDYLKCLPIR